MKEFEKLLNDEFITNDVLSMLEERGFQFSEKHLNDYHFTNHNGVLIVSIKDDEVLILDRTFGELPFIYLNTRYRKLDDDTVEKCELAADISDNFNFNVTTKTFLNVPYRGGYLEMEELKEDFAYSEEKIKRVFLDLRVRDGFSILEQLNEIGITSDKTVTKKTRKLGNNEDSVYDDAGNLIATIPVGSILLDNSKYRK